MKRIDTESYVKNFLNESYPKILILDRYEYAVGNSLYILDEVLFRTIHNDLLDSFVKDGTIIEENGVYYVL
jgi:hypothetical protein